ncbi:MAG: squalene/phytoene synthase family protein, partial [Acidobacteria bacterium]|nr:squalene/phytoene synthase family protein [Acidobacteriota bacterium]
MSRAGQVPLHGAYEACLRLACDHYENFPVASRLLPRHLRPHVAAIYAFARVADDVADEPGRTPDERLRILAEWRAHLHDRTRCTSARPDTLRTVEVFTALHETIAHFDLPIVLLDDLLSAFVQDVTTARYESWADVLDYCRRSANPVGRLVLRLTRQATPDRECAADAICTALQLTNFWQDLAIDWQRGRLYLPADEWQSRGADVRD